MAFFHLHIFSQALGVQTTVGVILPQRALSGEIGTENAAAGDSYKCLYLLHGLSDDESIWERRTGIERYASQYGIAVVMPFGGRSFYADEAYGSAYYTYIAKELPAIIEDMFRVSKNAEDRYIGGNSMGGYGALKIALRECGRYAAAFALSPVTDVGMAPFRYLTKNIFGEEIPDDARLPYLADLCEHDENRPRLYLTTGKGDFMYDDYIAFDAYMQKKAYDYTSVITEGGHDWKLWDESVQAALAWMLPKK